MKNIEQERQKMNMAVLTRKQFDILALLAEEGKALPQRQIEEKSGLISGVQLQSSYVR